MPVRERVEATFGEGALERAGRAEGRCGGGTAFRVSPRLKRALESARRDAAERHEEPTAAHVLIGMAHQRDSVAAHILDSHGVDAVAHHGSVGWPPAGQSRARAAAKCRSTSMYSNLGLSLIRAAP